MRPIGPRLAISDEQALMDVQPLVAGPIDDLSVLDAAERLFRAYLLYDELKLAYSPTLDIHVVDMDWESERRAKLSDVSERYGIESVGAEALEGQRKRAFGDAVTTDQIVGPDVTGAIDAWEADKDFDSEDSSENVRILEEHAANLISVVRAGGGLVAEGSLAREVIGPALQYPEKLFAPLDGRWADYVRRLEAGAVGLVVPPVTAIVLSRCARREAIPTVLRDLRDEWDRARRRMWAAVEQFEDARTLAEAEEAMKGLERAAELMRPDSELSGMPTFRNFWSLTTAVAAGAATATLSGGDLAVGAAVGGIKNLAELVTGVLANKDVVFRTGAFDLCREVRYELGQLPRMPELLRHLLSRAEREALGFS